MASRKKVTISWSGGKDSVFALYKILLSSEYEVVHLHTVFDSTSRKTALHEIHESLIEKQAHSIGIPLKSLHYNPLETDGYKKMMLAFYDACRSERIEAVVFGDLFLEDIRIFRDELLNGSGLNSIYPLWQINTNVMIDAFLLSGFKATICAADAAIFSTDIIGTVIGKDFIQNLPRGVDPCGENGEFHSFVCDGPIFKKPLQIHLIQTDTKHYRYKTKNAAGSPIEVTSSLHVGQFHHHSSCTMRSPHLDVV